MPTLHPLVLVCIAVLGLLLFALGLAVTIWRGRTGVLSGPAHEPDHLLNRLIRAHANTAEYAPFLALLFLLVGTGRPGALALVLVCTATAGRLLLALGLIGGSLTRPNAGRALGASLTYLAGLWLAALLLIAATHPLA